jgi:hypothetical protein
MLSRGTSHLHPRPLRLDGRIVTHYQPQDTGNAHTWTNQCSGEGEDIVKGKDQSGEGGDDWLVTATQVPIGLGRNRGGQEAEGEGAQEPFRHHGT